MLMHNLWGAGGGGANKVRYGRYASGEYKIRKKYCIHGEPKQILLFHSYGRKWKCGNVNIRAGLENPTSLSYAFSFFIWSEGFVSSLFAKMSFLHRQPVIFPSLYNKLTHTWWNREFSLFMKKNSETGWNVTGRYTTIRSCVSYAAVQNLFTPYVCSYSHTVHRFNGEWLTQQLPISLFPVYSLQIKFLPFL